MKTIKTVVVMLCCSVGTTIGAEIKPLVTKTLATLPDHPQVQLLTVEYGPGESSPPHRHNAHTFVYVLEGKVQMQVEGGDVATLAPGQTFYESPTDIHSLSKNASDAESTKFLVFFVKEAGAEATLPH